MVGGSTPCLSLITLDLSRYRDAESGWVYVFNSLADEAHQWEKIAVQKARMLANLYSLLFAERAYVLCRTGANTKRYSLAACMVLVIEM